MLETPQAPRGLVPNHNVEDTAMEEHMNLRAEFTIDCLFGMPGVPAEAGALATNPDGTFNRKSVETAYQIWERGHKSGVHQEKSKEWRKE